MTLLFLTRSSLDTMANKEMARVCVPVPHYRTGVGTVAPQAATIFFSCHVEKRGGRVELSKVRCDVL